MKRFMMLSLRCSMGFAMQVLAVTCIKNEFHCRGKVSAEVPERWLQQIRATADFLCMVSRRVKRVISTKKNWKHFRRLQVIFYHSRQNK